MFEKEVRLMERIHYGEEMIEFNLPESWEVVARGEPRAFPGVENEFEEVRRALKNPLGTERLSVLGKGRKNAVIITYDYTRPHNVPKYVIPPILEELNEAGLKDDQITLVMGGGSHLLATEEQIASVYGKDLLERLKVVVHNPDDNLVFVGVTPFNTPIFANNVVVEADLKIATGWIYPHIKAGYGAGAKTIFPGVMGRETICIHHAKHTEHEKSRPGILEGNPFREDIEEAAKLVGVDFMVDVVMNAEKKLVRCVAGDLQKAFQEGCHICDKIFCVDVPRKVDVVLTSGYPADTHLYQSLKGVGVAAEPIIKDGGTVIHSTPAYNGCLEGTYKLFAETQGVLVKDLLALLRRGMRCDPCVAGFYKPEIGLGVSTVLLQMLRERDVRVIVVNKDLSKDELNKMGFESARSVDEAIDMAKNWHQQAEVAILPAGAETMTRLTP
jgi:nickel-dependent lactate racemase